MEMSLNCKHEIVINAISIRKKKCLIISRAASIFVRNIGRDNLFQCFTNLTKDFFFFDKAKNFSSLKFSSCLIQREIIYCMAKQNIDFRA